MMNEQRGRIFREGAARSYDLRGGKTREPARILIVDPIVGSRFALAKEVAQPGVLAETAACADEARRRVERGGIALVLVDDDQSEGRRGLDFLVELRERSPEVRRALLIGNSASGFTREEYERAGLVFVIAKPWNPAHLRSAIRESLAVELQFATWDHRAPAPRPTSSSIERGAAEGDVDRRLDLLARGLLAGLNSCESESEIFELLHAELAASLDSRRWLWLDEESLTGGRIVGDWPLERGVRLESLSPEERRLVDHARRASRAARLDRRGPSASDERAACLGFTLKEGGRRILTAVGSVAPERASAVLALVREIQPGLALAIRRVRDAEARVLAARRLARRVSEELRTPVGALSHAIDRLRGEAVRAGMSTEWVDRVSSESDRLARAVERFEDEIGSEGDERSIVAN